MVCRAGVSLSGTTSKQLECNKLNFVTKIKQIQNQNTTYRRINITQVLNGDVSYYATCATAVCTRLPNSINHLRCCSSGVIDGNELDIHA